jgi:hypothetical protein
MKIKTWFWFVGVWFSRWELRRIVRKNEEEQNAQDKRNRAEQEATKIARKINPKH